MTKKEGVFKTIIDKCGVDRSALEEELKSLVEHTKTQFLDASPDLVEEKALHTLFNNYKRILKSGGVNIIGYVYGYDTANDRNSYSMQRGAEIAKSGDKAKIKEFEEKFKVKLSSDGTVKRMSRQGQEFDSKPKYQRNVWGFCKEQESDKWHKFVLYWESDTLEHAQAKKPIVYKPVEFRGIITEKEDGSYSISSVPETDFKLSKEKVPEFEDLVKKLFNKPMTAKEVEKLNVKDEVFMYDEIRGYTPNPKYGDRFTIPLGDAFSFDTEDLIIQLEPDFNLYDNTEGWSTNVKCLIFGTYKPYVDKKTQKLVKKISATGLYVMKRDRVASSNQKQTVITEDETKNIQQEW